MELLKERQEKIFDALKGELGWKNVFEVPKIEKIVINVGTGKRARTDKKRNELVAERLAKITGQKPASKGAKFSIAGFKIRQGDVVAQSVTLRGNRAISFFDKLIHVALPRTKDFRGIDRKSVDEMGNLTIGIKEHTIFPETSDEEISNIFGMSVTVVISSSDRNEATKYLEFMGVPFKKGEK